MSPSFLCRHPSFLSRTRLTKLALQTPLYSVLVRQVLVFSFLIQSRKYMTWIPLVSQPNPSALDHEIPSTTSKLYSAFVESHS